MLKIRQNILFTFIIIGLTLTSCDNEESNPTGAAGETGAYHTDADGVQLSVDGTIIYKELEGQYYIDGVESDTSAIIIVDVGMEKEILVEFLNEDGVVLEPDDFADDTHTLGFSTSESDIISTEIHTSQESEDDLLFILTGESEGTVTLRVKLMHGNHHDYRSKLISVTVNP